MGRIGQMEKENIDLELLERVNVFKVPENYFLALELNTNIERFEKNNIFKVPYGYFESLNKNILSNITTKLAKTIKVNWWKTTTTKWSAAASVILIVGLWLGISQFTKDKTELALEKVSNPYGEGGATAKIFSSIKAVSLDGIIKKRFYNETKK
jgi:hypothetical protein